MDESGFANMSENTAVPATPAPGPVPSTGKRRKALLALGLCLVAVVAAGLGFYLHKPKPVAQALAMDPLGLSHPDALLETRSLSQLPRDLLSVPFLRETLTEDFVFYYETHGDRLGLIGSLRRIIYEHDLKLQDDLVEALFDQPANVALWRGADGRLKDFLLVMDRGGLARLLEPLAQVALDDQQLSKVGELKVGGDTVPLYRLAYNASKSLLFASRGDKLVVLSNPDKLYDHDTSADVAPGGVSTQALAALLGGSPLFPEAFGLQPMEAGLKQRIAINASVLAMGYQRFIPTFAGIRLDMDDKGWHSYLALSETDNSPDLDFNPIWQAMPVGASACVALPLATDQQQPLLVKLGADEQTAKALTGHMSGAAGLCWYADSHLYTPLLVAGLDTTDGNKLDADLGRLFGNTVGAWESKVPGGQFPVTELTPPQGHQWQRQVSSNFGQYRNRDAEKPESITGKGFFKVSLARHGSTLLFSLDDKLVDKALGALDKHVAPLADIAPKDALMSIYLGPDSLAQLMQQETLDSLPQDMEPVFRNAAQTHLIPKLQKLAGYGKYALTLPKGSEPDGLWQWLPLQWRAL